MMGHNVRYLYDGQSLETGTPQFSLKAVTKKAIYLLRSEVLFIISKLGFNNQISGVKQTEIKDVKSNFFLPLWFPRFSGVSQFPLVL